MLKVQGFSPGVLCPLLVDCCKGLPLCAVDVNLLRWWCKSEISIGVIPSVCDAGWLMSLWRYLKHLIICKFLCHFYMKWIKVYVLKTFVFTWIIINSKTNSFVTVGTSYLSRPSADLVPLFCSEQRGGFNHQCGKCGLQCWCFSQEGTPHLLYETSAAECCYLTPTLVCNWLLCVSDITTSYTFLILLIDQLFCAT